MKRKTKVLLTQWTLVLAGAIFLEFLARAGIVRRSMLVPVSEMFTTLYKLVISGQIHASFLKDTSIASNFFITFLEIVLSFSLAVIVGLPAGLFLWKNKRIARILNPYLVSYYAIPTFALYPVFVAVFGLGLVPITLMGWMMAIVAIVINAATGFTEVDKRIYPQVGRSLRLSRWKIFAHIYFPSATPYIFTGLKLGFIYAIIGVIASEFILSTEGLGHLVAFSYSAFEIPVMYASMLLIILIAILINAVLMWVEARLYGKRAR